MKHWFKEHVGDDQTDFKPALPLPGQGESWEEAVEGLTGVKGADLASDEKAVKTFLRKVIEPVVENLLALILVAAIALPLTLFFVGPRGALIEEVINIAKELMIMLVLAAIGLGVLLIILWKGSLRW